jgi:hypothetical protein
MKFSTTGQEKDDLLIQVTATPIYFLFIRMIGHEV